LFLLGLYYVYNVIIFVICCVWFTDVAFYFLLYYVDVDVFIILVLCYIMFLHFVCFVMFTNHHFM